MRAPGMTFTRMPLFVWGQFATAPLLMIATTALAAALAALFIERQFGVPFYDPTKGGSPVMWQHMFWFYSHPAVYIMILPAFGIISEVLPTFARKPIFGYKMIAFSSMAIALAGFMVWAHHMFTSGLAPYLAAAVHDHHVRDRGADRHQDLLVGRDAVGRQDPLHARRCSSPSASSRSSRSAESPESSSPRFRSICTCTVRTSWSRTSTTCSSAAA